MRIFLLSLLTLALAGCGNDNKANQNPTQPPPPPTLLGTHISSCYSESRQAKQDTLGVFSGQFRMLTETFAGSSCDTNQVTFLSEISAKIDRDADSRAKAGTHEIDLTITGVQITLASDQWAGFWNREHACGISDWKAGEPREVAGKECLGVKVPAAGEHRYQIYQLRGDGSLRLGKKTKDHDEKTPQKRPTQIDETKIYNFAAS